MDVLVLGGRLKHGTGEQHSPRRAPSSTVRSANEHDALRTTQVEVWRASRSR